MVDDALLNHARLRNAVDHLREYSLFCCVVVHLVFCFMENLCIWCSLRYVARWSRGARRCRIGLRLCVTWVLKSSAFIWRVDDEKDDQSRSVSKR